MARGDWELVARGLQDRLHQPHRAHLYPRSLAMAQRAAELGALGASISGAGPTVVLWCLEGEAGPVRARLEPECAGWADVLSVGFEPRGAAVLR